MTAHSPAPPSRPLPAVGAPAPDLHAVPAPAGPSGTTTAAPGSPEHYTAAAPDPVIEQAKRDIDAGLVDTDMRATPGLDAARRKALVPGPAGKPPR
jgi:hypothetical protein